MFLPLWLVLSLCVGGGYVAAKGNVTPSSITSIFSPAPQAPAAK